MSVSHCEGIQMGLGRFILATAFKTNHSHGQGEGPGCEERPLPKAGEVYDGQNEPACGNPLTRAEVDFQMRFRGVCSSKGLCISPAPPPPQPGSFGGIFFSPIHSTIKQLLNLYCTWNIKLETGCTILSLCMQEISHLAGKTKCVRW